MGCRCTGHAIQPILAGFHVRHQTSQRALTLPQNLPLPHHTSTKAGPVSSTAVAWCLPKKLANGAVSTTE